jgi:calcium-dependent protein kinase
MSFIRTQSSITWLQSNISREYRYCEGGDLLNKIKSLGPFSERRAAKVMRQILSAIDTCHKRNIVHRDLKPENILFKTTSAESTVKVIDFGRSKLLKPKEKISEFAGSVT